MTKSNLKASPPKRSRLSESALQEATKRKKSSNRGTKSDYFTRTNSDSESDFEEESRKRKTPIKKSASSTSTVNKSKVSKSKSKSKPKGLPYWCEVYVKNSGWVTVDVDQGRVDCAQEMEERCAISPLLYVVAINADGTFKDVTRYVRFFLENISSDFVLLRVRALFK